MVAMHSNLLLSQTTPQETVILQEDALQVSDSETANITWPLLSGESVQSLAVLFYPKNKRMQQLFISKTLQLSREVHPDLKATSTTNQASLIVIPNIKLLAKHSGRIKPAPLKNASSSEAQSSKLHMSYGLKDAQQFALSPKMQADYENLVKRNAALKLELEKLNTKLAHLQEVMAALNVEARRVQSRPEPTPTSSPEPVVKVQNKPKPLSAIKYKITSPPNSVVEQTLFTTQSMAITISALILAIGFFFALRLYRRRQAGNPDLLAVDSFTPMATQAFINTTDVHANTLSSLNAADFATIATEYSGSVSDLNLENMIVLTNKEDAELVLEQARIYTKINRERDAIKLLKSHIQSEPQDCLNHWIYLLEIYRNTNQKEEFLQSARKLHESYNIITPQWERKPLNAVVSSSLEEFPHIVEHLIQLWGDCDKDAGKTAETKAYLDELLTDNRNSERTGFSLEVLQEIILLREILDLREKLVKKVEAVDSSSLS